ncbi:MAG: hypothetical protein ACN4GW_05335, partial [Desulforhopalus sp.]
MSYILDALKKSDQERHQEAPPHLHSNHGYPPSFKDSGRYSQKLITGAIVAMSLLLGGAGMYFFNNMQEPIQQPVAKVAPPAPAPITQQINPAPEPVVTVVESPKSPPEV